MKGGFEFTKQKIAIKNNIAYNTECYYFFFFLLFVFVIWFYLFYFFFNLGVLDSKLTNPKLGDRPQLWPVLPPVFSLLCYIHHETDLLHHVLVVFSERSSKITVFTSHKKIISSQFGWLLEIRMEKSLEKNQWQSFIC